VVFSEDLEVYWSRAVGGLESLGFYVGIIPGFLVCFVADCVAS
jgi:hypothetical protein